MVLRDLSYWGIFKLTLIVEMLVPLIMTPIILLFLLMFGSDFEWGTGEMTFSGFDIYGLKLEASPDFVLTLPASIFGIALVLILILLQCGVLHLIFQKTRFGNVKIGS